MTTTTKKCVCFWCSPFQVFSPFLFLWATTKIGAKRYVVACYYLVKQWGKSLLKVYFDSCFLGISWTDFVMTMFECWMSNTDFSNISLNIFFTEKKQILSINTFFFNFEQWEKKLKKHSFFGRIDNTTICFWDLWTFS